MLSRVAHSIYWMARYIERAENVARFIDVTHNLLVDRRLGEQAQWQPLVLTSGDRELFNQRYGSPSRDHVVQFLALDRDYPNSIVSCLAAARENARTVREAISREMWEQLNALYLSIHKTERLDAEQLFAFFECVRLGCITVAGLSDATMSRGEAWHWARMGRMLERADKTSRILDVKYFLKPMGPAEVGSNDDHVHWTALLQSTSALQMYRQTYQDLASHHVVEFLLLNQFFPRSVSYCLARADDSLHAITGIPAGQFGSEAEKRMGRARSELCYASIDEIIAGGLHEFIDEQQRVFNRIDDLLFQQFFAVTDIPGQQQQQ